MLSDCDPPTFQRRCEKPKKLQGATSQQQTTLQPETEGVVETGDAEKQNWYRYHCLNWMEGQRNGERWFEFGSGSIVSVLSEMVWACSSTLVLAFLNWDGTCLLVSVMILGGLYLGVFGFVQWLFEINRCPFRLWFGSGKKHISRPGNSGGNRTRGSWKGEEGRRRTNILSFFERNILLWIFTNIFSKDFLNNHMAWMHFSLYIDTYHWPVLESEPPSMSFSSKASASRWFGRTKTAKWISTSWIQMPRKRRLGSCRDDIPAVFFEERFV